MEANVRQKHILRIAYLASICLLAFFGGFSFVGTRGAWFLGLGALVTIKQFLAKQIRLDLSLFVVIAFAVMLFSFRTIYSSFEFAYLVAYAFLPIAMFILGCETSHSKSELLLVVVALALGHIAFVTGNVVYTLQSGTVVNPQFGIFDYCNFWTHQSEPRTFFSIDTTIGAALGVSLLVYPRQGKKWLIRILGGFLLLSYLVFAVTLGVRSPIVVAPLTLVLVAFHALSKEKDRKKKLVALSVFGGFALLFALFWTFTANNLFGLKDLLLKIPGFNRFISEGGTDDARIRHYQIFAEHWLEYPWGGMYQAGLLGNDRVGDAMQFHNGFLQLFTYGGFPLVFIATMLLVLLGRQIVLIKRTSGNASSLTLAISIIASFFAISMIEPILTSGPFICPYVLFAGGYLAGELAKQRQEKPFFVFGLNDWQETASFSKRNLAKLILFVVFGISGGVLVSLTSGSPFYAISMLAASALTFLLIDKTQYNVVSWVKTAISFVFATVIVLVEFWLLPNPSPLFSIIKTLIGVASYLLLRIVIIQKRDPENGYRALRNMLICICKDVSLPEENLVD